MTQAAIEHLYSYMCEFLYDMIASVDWSTI